MITFDIIGRPTRVYSRLAIIAYPESGIPAAPERRASDGYDGGSGGDGDGGRGWEGCACSYAAGCTDDDHLACLGSRK
jgi:hypothetical protein